MKRTSKLSLDSSNKRDYTAYNPTASRYVELLKELLKHGKLNTNSPPLRVCDIEEITKDLGNPLTVYKPEDYEKLAEQNMEPEEAVLFYLPDGAASGHFIGVYTDSNKRIHYGDSFGDMNPIYIHPANRVVVAVRNAVQNVKTSNCGWLAMLYALTHNKTRPVDRNPDH